MMLRLAECSALEVGRKGARLQWLQRRGYSIPQTWVVPASLQPEVLRLSGCDSVRDFVRQRVILPDTLVRDVVDLVQGSPTLRFVARSSSNAEDLPFANAAGQYGSFLDLDTVDAVLSAICLCYKSSSNPQVLDYLQRVGIDVESQQMAILVQEMVSSRWSGVTYGRAPLSPEEVVVEYTSGLGVSVVAGRDAPGWALIDRRTGEVKGDLPDGLTGTDFLKVALDLEAEFGGPQDIEWGWSDELVLFQSRDITTVGQSPVERKFDIDVPKDATLDLRPFGYGLCVGRLCRDVSEGTSALGKVLVMGDDPCTRERAMALMGQLSGVIFPSGGILSHFAALCRERSLPGGVCSATGLDSLVSMPVVVDCDGRMVYPADSLDSVSRKKVVFNWAWTLADRPGLGVERHVKVEGVIAESALVRQLLMRLLDLGIEGAEVVQVIEPFDFPDRVYCGISARIQYEPSWCRLQFKRALSSEDGKCRSDEEAHIPFDGPQDARDFLADLGYAPRPVQERALLKFSLEGVRLQFNLWPGASGVYVGIEAPDEATLGSFLKGLGMSVAVCHGLDGTDLFRMFGISLENCRFSEGRPPSVAEFTLRSGT